MDEKTKYYLKMFSKFAIIAFILLCTFGLYKLAVFYMPFVIALIIASIAEPLIKFFMKRCKMKRKLASVISLLIIVGIIAIILTMLISSIVSESVKLVENLNVYATEAYNTGMGILKDIQEGRIEIPQEVIQMIEKSYSGFLDAAKTVIGNFFTGVVNTISAIPNGVTFSVITILAVIFICFDRQYIIDICNKHIPAKWIEKVKMLLKETFSVGVEYIKAEAKLSSICFILVLIGLLAMDLFGLNVEFPIIMAIFIGFVDLLPIFGAGTVMIPWAIYLVIIGNIPLAIGVAILWGIWAVIKNLIEPKMISNQMGLHPIFTLIAMYTGLRIFGILGLMIGPIVLIVLKNIFSELINKGVLKAIFEQD